MKKLLLFPFILITACTTTKVDDHSYVNIYQHNAEKNQTELAIASMQKQTYKRRQVRTEEHEEYPINSYNNRSFQQPPKAIRETPPLDYSSIDEPYIYDPKPTSRNEERSSNKALIMPDELGVAYQRSTGNPYVSARLIDHTTLPKPPLYAIYGTTNKIYIMPSDMNRILSGQRVCIDIP